MKILQELFRNLLIAKPAQSRTAVLFAAGMLIALTPSSEAVAKKDDPSRNGVRYTIADTAWDSDSLGNHRAIVDVQAAGRVARVVVEWRRRDLHPEEKELYIVDARTHARVLNVSRGAINRERGELYFEPTSGPGKYYVYYLPYKQPRKSNYPNNKYPKPEPTADSAWLALARTGSSRPEARVTEIQSIDALDSFSPMEVIATAAETDSLIKQSPGKAFLVFPEERIYPIRMKNDLPRRWILAGNRSSFSGEAARGEYFAFQLGVYALREIDSVRVVFSDLAAAGGSVIPAARLSCINDTGTAYDGAPMTKVVSVAQGSVQAMWCGVDVPQDARPGLYSGTATVRAAGERFETVRLSLTVRDTLFSDGGVNEPWKQTRLKWLNSTLAQKNDVIAPYVALTLREKTIGLLGRSVEIGDDGLPRRIRSFFTPEMTSLSKTPSDILGAPIRFVVKDGDGKALRMKPGGVTFGEVTPGTISWDAASAFPSIDMAVHASIEFDGFVSYQVRMTALRDVSLSEIAMEMPFAREFATYFMGLGRKGGVRPDTVDWKWNVAEKNQDGAWIGDVNGGLHFSLRAEDYSRPLNTNFYLQKPLNLPASWGNEGKGGIVIVPGEKAVVVRNYSGERTMKKGDALYFNFTLLITPFHTLDTKGQWSERYYHKYSPIDTVIARGANVVNIHHATPVNPYLNYPFIAHREMKAYVDEAHAKRLKVKIYNTIRELSNRAYETFPLRSLGHEIYSPGKGGGYSWLQEHLGDDYIAAWFVPELKDAAIINSGMSRWHNYYVEGMNWLVRNVGIDGLYLDDVAFDRVTMKRVKRVLTQDGHPGMIDLHSANQYNKNDGFNNSACLYLEHFPYLNRLWFGEYFDYEKNGPDFFLTEVSGIPFGLMGEMLEGGGNPWRGMVYGMTNRMPWTENSDPSPLWKVWDDFGMSESRMTGYWVKGNPVLTGNGDVKATIFRKKGSALIAVASWAPADTAVKLRFNWKALGISRAKAVLTAPEVRGFQSAFTISPDESFMVPKGKGFLLILHEQ